MLWHKETREEKIVRKNGFQTAIYLSGKEPLRKYADRKLRGVKKQ